VDHNPKVRRALPPTKDFWMYSGSLPMMLETADR